MKKAHWIISIKHGVNIFTHPKWEYLAELSGRTNQSMKGICSQTKICILKSKLDQKIKYGVNMLTHPKWEYLIAISDGLIPCLNLCKNHWKDYNCPNA